MADDASIGITSDSVVSTQEELLRRVDYVVNCYHQSALVEEYISGREFSISMWGNARVTVLPITEMDYSGITDPLRHILTYDSKWNPASFDYRHTPTHCPAVLSPEDEARIVDIAIGAYRAIGLRDFGRADIRYHNGVPYIIDINEIPDLSPDSGFPNAARVAGYTYAEMAEQILEFALQREGWQCHQPILKSLSPRLQTVSASSD